ncbi:MAG: hypothetical protein HW413_1070 [Thermoleophilia bacterium]|nr:hypothetical protein [Thermoleophilia bacterium]
MPRDRYLRGSSWPLGGATGERRRCWTPRCRSPVAKRTPGAEPLRGSRPGGSVPDASDRASGRARSWQRPSGRPQLSRAPVESRNGLCRNCDFPAVEITWKTPSPSARCGTDTDYRRDSSPRRRIRLTPKLRRSSKGPAHPGPLLSAGSESANADSDPRQSLKRSRRRGCGVGDGRPTLNRWCGACDRRRELPQAGRARRSLMSGVSSPASRRRPSAGRRRATRADLPPRVPGASHPSSRVAAHPSRSSSPSRRRTSP